MSRRRMRDGIVPMIVAAAIAAGLPLDWATAAEASAPGAAGAREVPSGVPGERWFATGDGFVRVRSNDRLPQREPAIDASPVRSVTSPAGVKMRVLPAPANEPAPASVDPRSLPAVSTVSVPNGALRRIAGVPAADAAVGAPTATAGLRVVDLPPGAKGPLGTPEPSTLYRVAPLVR